MATEQKPKTKPKAEPKPKETVYRLESTNPYLYIAPFKAQFVKGVYETTDKAVADYLQNYTQIKLVK